MGGFGQLALARDAALGQQVNPMLPMEAMGAGAGLMGLLTGQAQQARLAPLQQQMMQQRVQAGQMQLDAEQRHLRDQQLILNSLQNNRGNMGAVLKDPSVYGQIDPDAYVNLQAEHTKMLDVQGQMDDRELQLQKDRNSRRAAMMFGAAQMGPQAWAQNGPAIIAGYNAIGDDEKLDPNTPFEAVPRIALQHATLTEYHAQEELQRQQEQDAETQRHNQAMEADKNQPKPGVDVPFSPAVQQQKIDIARQSRPPREPKDQGLTMMVPGPNGQPMLQRFQPGDALPEGAVTPQQYGSTVTPTSQIRTQAENAQQMIRLIDTITPRIDALDKQGKLGPMAGRYQNFLRGKVGSGDPDYTFLNTLNELSQTLALQAHMGSRGAVQVLDKFTNMLDAGKMAAPTLKAAYSAARLYFADRAKSGQIKGWGSNQQPAAGSQPNVTHVWTPNGLQAVGGNQ